MIRSVTVTNYLDESLEMELFHPEKSGFIITDITGIGAASANINVTEVPTGDGGLFNSARLNSRSITISLKFFDNYGEGETIEVLRHKSYKYFPVKHKLKLRFKTDERESEITGYVESNEPNIFDESEGCTISIICPDPNIYSDENSTTVFSGYVPMFEFPFSNESLTDPLLIMAEMRMLTQQTVFYSGNVEVGITIVIHATGPASNVTIYNSDTRQVMHIDTAKLQQMTTHEIIAGDTIYINTQKGSKSATLLRRGREINILNCVIRNSDWFTLKSGDNLFAYEAEQGSENLQFSIINRIVYEGV